MSRAASRTLAAVLLSLAAHSAAGAELLTGTLAQWLEKKAAPALVETMGRHPRFQGESLQIVPMRNGEPSAASDALTEEIRRYLTYELLKQSQLRVLWRAPDTRCEVLHRPPLLLGVELSRRGTSQQRAQLRLAVIDPQENIWVPGINLRWQGNLTRAQQRARAQSAGTPQSDAVAVDRNDTEALAERLVADMACRLPFGLEGTVYIAAAEQPALAELRTAVMAQLASRPRYAFATDAARADWLIQLSVREAAGEAPDRGSLPTLRAVLRDAEGHSEQWLAQINLSTAPGAPVTAADTSRADRRARAPLAVAPFTLSNLAPCPDRPEERCALIETETSEASYLLAFQTRDGHLEGRFCSDALALRPAGSKRYRVRLDEAERVSLHLVATADRALAKTLRSQLRRAPGQCNGAATSYQSWLQQLSRVLGKGDAGYEWRTLTVSEDALSQVAATHPSENP